MYLLIDVGKWIQQYNYIMLYLLPSFLISGFTQPYVFIYLSIYRSTYLFNCDLLGVPYWRAQFENLYKDISINQMNSDQCVIKGKLQTLVRNNQRQPKPH